MTIFHFHLYSLILQEEMENTSSQILSNSGLLLNNSIRVDAWKKFDFIKYKEEKHQRDST